MRILFYCCGSENPGVEALSAYLKSKGHTVGLLFDPRQGSNFYFNVPLLNNFVSRDMLLRKARAFEPELVAVSFLTNQFQEVGAFMSYLRQHIHVPVIAGGFHAFSLPDMLIKEDWVDMLCLGEGEETMAELADAMSRNEPYDNIRNLWIKKIDGQIVKNPLRPLIKNLDALPIPDKDIFVPYGIINRRLMVMTSRGCPYKCSYCINSFRDALYPTQKYLRRKTPEAAIDELIEYKKKFKPRFIQFYDDVFSYDAAWLETFSTLYPQKIGLPFECYITPTTANEKIVSLLKKSGCVSVIMGVQSGDENVRKNLLNRHYSNQKVIEAAALVKKYKIKLITEYIFGFPDDDYNSMIQAYDLNDKLNADYTGSFIFYPFPQTELSNYCLSNSYLSEADYQRVQQGAGSMHQLDTLIKTTDKELIYKFYAVLPLYNMCSPYFKKILRKQLLKPYGFRHKLINLISIPLLDLSYVLNKVLSIPIVLIKTRRYLKKGY